MKHLRTLLSLALLGGAVVAMPSGAAEVYKCVSADGKVSYSSQPCPKDAAAEKLRLQRSQTAEQQDDGEQDAAQSSLDERIAKETNPVAKAQLEIQKQQCELVRTQLKQYEQAPYLIRKKEDGSEERLSEEESNAERQRLRDYLAKECR